MHQELGCVFLQPANELMISLELEGMKVQHLLHLFLAGDRSTIVRRQICLTVRNRESISGMRANPLPRRVALGP